MTDNCTGNEDYGLQGRLYFIGLIQSDREAAAGNPKDVKRCEDWALYFPYGYMSGGHCWSFDLAQSTTVLADEWAATGLQGPHTDARGRR